MGRLSARAGLLALVVLATSSASAQITAHRFAGFVADSSGKPIADARIHLLSYGGARHAMASDSAGRFVFPAIPAGRARLNVRRLGFEPYDLSLVLGESETADSVRVVLTVAVLELNAVDVTETAGAPQEYYDRKQSHFFGRFIDGKKLEENYGKQPSEILRGVPGIILMPSNRIGSLVRMRGCRPTIWVDGMRAGGAELDDVISSSDISGVEVYNSAAGLPVRYLDRTTSCGAILVWTRSR